MNISDDLVRQLMARREGSALDFKEEIYANSQEGSAELAKDIMAIANGLRPNGEHGYILIGVAEDPVDKTGVLKGFTQQEWATDSNLQQKVRGVLNRLPKFSWSQVEVDGSLVGVIEIRPGGRPFFPLKEGKNIKRFVALHRTGSSTDIASPDEIIGWAREDANQRANDLEVEHREAELAVIPRLKMSGGSTSGGRWKRKFLLINDGKAMFEPASAECAWKLHPGNWRQWLQNNHVRWVEDMPPYVQSVSVPEGMVKEGKFADIEVAVTREQLEQHFSSYLRKAVEGELHGMPPYIDFLVAELHVVCQGINKDRENTAKISFRWE